LVSNLYKMLQRSKTIIMSYKIRSYCFNFLKIKFFIDRLLYFKRVKYFCRFKIRRHQFFLLFAISELDLTYTLFQHALLT